MDWEFGANKCKLLYMEWKNNRFYCMAREQYSILCDKSQWKRKYCVCVYIYTLNHFSVEQKLTL